MESLPPEKFTISRGRGVLSKHGKPPQNVEMRLDLRRISAGGGALAPVHTAVGFRRGEGLSGEGHFPDQG